MQTALDVVEFLKPKPCPVEMVRIGGTGDGAYLVPDDLTGIEACYSPGVLNRKDFEDDLQDQFGIGAHMCDFSSDVDQFATPLREGQSFRKKWLGVEEDQDTITLKNWIDEQTPGEADLLLQMDIEGAEFETIMHAPADVLRRFRVILIEIHQLGRLNRASQLAQILPFFQKLAQHHTSVHLHPNNANPQIRIGKTDYWIPKVIELTLLRSDRIAAGGKMISPQMPHPLDIAYNVSWRQPQAMGKVWSS